MTDSMFWGAVTLALFALSLFALRTGPGFRNWPTSDRITFILMVISLWPWVVVAFIVDPPGWYTATALTVAAGAFAAFVIGTFRWLRAAKAAQAAAAARIAELESQIGMEDQN